MKAHYTEQGSKDAIFITGPFHLTIEARVSNLFKRTPGNNNQEIKVGDVILVHNEGPRIDWKLAVVEELIIGGDDLVRAANI